MPASLRTFATTFVADDQVVLEAATNMCAIVELLERHTVGSSSQELGQGRGVNRVGLCLRVGDGPGPQRV